jgi:3-deoxy-manno-octulosonate cytidylyltransferase (CMP-KDO synthetase)
VVATDDAEVAAAANALDGVRAVMTSEHPRTGSERCAEAALDLPHQILVDIQGDWPEVHPDDLRRLVEHLATDPTSDRLCATLAAPLTDPDKIADPNVVKIARGHDGRALYFSRLPIPYDRSTDGPRTVWRHIGVYGFTRATLLRIPELPSSGLDESEGLEQLRFLENDIAIRVLDATGDPWGIECRQDYDAFLQRHAERTTETSS